MNDNPEVGEWLRRKDDGRWAQVAQIAKKDEVPVMAGPVLIGDIIMRYSAFHHSACSPGEYFWSRWERPDFVLVAKVALEEGVRYGR